MDTLDVLVEVTVSRGLPQCTIIGLPDKTIQEARDRVLTAIRESGYSIKLSKIIINLSPAELKKDGGKYDLPMALAILTALEVIHPKNSSGISIMGELSLSGEIRGVRGILAMLIGAISSGTKRFIVPEENRSELEAIDDCELCFVSTLQEAANCLETGSGFTLSIPDNKDPGSWNPDFSNLAIIQGQEMAKRAALIAAAGWHHIVMYGPAGVGKTLLANAIPGLLAPMSQKEILETRAIYNLFGWEEKGAWDDIKRPIRMPHHSASDIAIIGGGSNPRPGEVSCPQRRPVLGRVPGIQSPGPEHVATTSPGKENHHRTFLGLCNISRRISADQCDELVPVRELHGWLSPLHLLTLANQTILCKNRRTDTGPDRSASSDDESTGRGLARTIKFFQMEKSTSHCQATTDRTVSKLRPAMEWLCQ